MPMNQFRLVTLRRFGPLFATQFLGALNDNIYKNALVIFIAFGVASADPGASSLLVILAGGIFILPFFLFSATAGLLADKYEKSMLIRRIKLAEVVIMAAGALGFYLGNLTWLLVVLFFMGAQSTLFGPLKYGILPQHLDETELTGGNGMIQMGTYLAILLGTILGGVLIAVKGAGVWLISVTVLAVAALGYAASRLIPRATPPDPGLAVSFNCVTQTMRVMGYARENATVFTGVLAISWFWFLGATFLSLVPSYTRDLLAGNEHVATVLLTAFSIGIGTGSLLCEKFSRGHIELGLVPLGLAGISLLAFDLFLAGAPETGPGVATAGEFLQRPGSWRVLLDLAGIGLFGGLYIVPLYAMVQHRCNPLHRARIIAANNVLNALFMVCSAAITLALFRIGVPIPGIFLLLALANVLVFALLFRYLPESWQRGRALLGFEGRGRS
jgi:hypothetical protein